MAGHVKGIMGRYDTYPHIPYGRPRITGLGLMYVGNAVSFDLAWADARYGGGGGSVTAYVHTQGVASDTWTINHNLGYQPQVETYSVGGVQMFGDVTHTSVNQTIVTFNTALAGTARLL